MSDLIGIIDEIGITKNVYRTASKLVRKENSVQRTKPPLAY